MSKKLKAIALGGVEEVGKNLTVFEYGEDIIVVDCGMAFPDEEMLGIDFVIPDMTYLYQNKERVRGILLTHGHEDHIGALPYMLANLDVPVYGTPLTIGFVRSRLQEHNLTSADLRVVHARDTIRLGAFTVELIKTNHSIVGSVALCITCPVGRVLFTSDFKIDYTPIDNDVIDLARIAELGAGGVLALFADSTNVELPGSTISERTVGETLDDLFRNITGRIIISTFSSNIHRIQQIVDSSIRYGRKVCLTGRSMLRNAEVAMDLGLLNIDDKTLVDVNMIQNIPGNQLVIITTGSQGEPMSGLVRMASHQHSQVEIVPGDTVIISASPIPGNETFVNRVIDQMFRCGAHVIYGSLAKIHASGHACQEELKLIHSLVKAKYFIPMHGEYRHLRQHALLAEHLGMPRENIFMPQIGKVIEMDEHSCAITGSVTAGAVMVDGLGIGDVGSVVLRDRRHLSNDGLMIVVMSISTDDGKLVSEPDVISRGFVYVKASENLMDECRDLVQSVYDDMEISTPGEWAPIKSNVKHALSKFLYERTKRRPMILPIIVEI